MQAPDIDSDLFVEVLGILVNLDIPSYDWPAFTAKHDLLTLLAGKLAQCDCTVCSPSDVTTHGGKYAEMVCGLIGELLIRKSCMHARRGEERTRWAQVVACLQNFCCDLCCHHRFWQTVLSTLVQVIVGRCSSNLCKWYAYAICVQPVRLLWLAHPLVHCQTP